MGHSFNSLSLAESALRMLQFSFLSLFTSVSLMFSVSHHTVPYSTRLDGIERQHTQLKLTVLLDSSATYKLKVEIQV